MITRVFQRSLASSILGWRQPAHLILHVTSRCNARCGMCFAWRRLNKNKDLTLKEIEKIAQELQGLIFLDISGGEPFLRNDLAEILALFEQYSPGTYVNLPTNGLLPEKTEKETQRILEKTNLPLSLNLSLDGLGKTHDQIRGVKGCFKKVLLTYKKLGKIKVKNPQLSLKAATVITNQSLTELEDLANFVKKKMPAIDFHTLILFRGEPPDKSFALPSVAELEKKKPLFFKIWQDYGYGKNLGWLGSKVANVSHRHLLELYLKSLEEKKMALPCLAGQAHAVIFANGDLAFCELRKPIGNLRKVNFDFQKLWYSQEAKKQRRQISRNQCFCAHGCVWVDNLFFNLRTYPALTRELIKSFC